MAGITSTKKIKGQPHLLAYITPNEVEKLKALGGQETMTPEGVPAYPEFDNYGYSSQADFDAGDRSKSNDPNVRGEGPGQNRVTASQLAAINAKEKEAERQKVLAELSVTPFNRNKRLSKLGLYNNLYQKDRNKKLAQKRAFQKYQDIEQYADLMDDYGLTAEQLAAAVEANPSYGYDFSNLDLGKKTLGSNIGTNLEKYRTNLYDVQPKTKYSVTQAILDKLRPDTQVTAMNTLNKARSYNKAVNAFDIRGEIDRLGNLGNSNLTGQFTGGDNDVPQPYLPFDYNTGAALPIDDVAEEKTFDYRFGTGQNVGADVLRGYVANGGRITRAGGGIMNAVPRQGYFLGGIGKAIKGVVGGVADAAGKVLKSDVGKMALLAAGAYYTGGALGGTGGFNNFATLGSKAMQGAKFLGKKALFTDGALDFGKAAILGASALPFFMKQPEDPDIGMTDRGGRLIDPLTGEEGTPASMRANIENAKIEAGGDPVKLAQLNQKYNNMLFSNLPYENYGTYAQGGRIKAQEGGLMNLGGMEKDYRAEGGFVPIGKQEKADDVPARLSVNEFVFTADAVRNAGGGDIDKGAEVMENMMKNLENGGTVSEESQGNTGAQNMFSVSERIGEVI